MNKWSKKAISSMAIMGLLATFPTYALENLEVEKEISKNISNQYEITSSEWEKLGDHAETIKDVIEQENLDDQQAKNLITTWIEKDEENNKQVNSISADSSENKNFTVVDNMVYDSEGNELHPTPTRLEEGKLRTEQDNYSSENKSSQRASYSSDYDIVGNSNDRTGSHWMAISKRGYRKCTGYFTLPNVNIKNKNNTFPYAYFGAYAYQGSDNPLVSDAGILYQNGGWYAFMNFNVWNDGTRKYEQDWDEREINPSSDRVYMIYEINSSSRYDTGTITIIDPTDWSTLRTYTSDSTRDLADRDVVNSSYSNLEMVKETTLAQKYENLNDGSSIRNACWSNVYLYGTSDYSKWTSSQTKEAGYGTTRDHARTITVNSCSKWYEDDIDINY